MNIPSNREQDMIPDQAKGNPVYEQTRQDMPLWCCGRNCGRNSRIVVFVLGMLGIACSSVVCLSPNYFSFVSSRNDTFYDLDKQQPKPFEYAVEANVGIFRYEILEVYEYPWPPKGQRDLFDAIHERELKRLAAVDRKVDNTKYDQNIDDVGIEGRERYGFNRITQSISNTIVWSFNRLLINKFPDEFYDDDLINSKSMDDDNDHNNNNDDDNVSNPPQNYFAQNQNDTLAIILTKSPSDTPHHDIPVSDIPDILPGSNAISRLPTTSPTPSPTRTNPNDLIDVEIGVVKPYPAGVNFDSFFMNGQKGAMWAPILATIGLAFSLVEFCCCTYKCSWLPTALCLYGSFMLQLMTMFIFMSEDFCKYDQDCALGFSGFLSVVAVMAYMISQMLVCMTPRPPPLYDLCKKPPVKRKKKKKKKTPDYFDEKWGLVEDDNSNEDEFVDEPNAYLDLYGGDYYSQDEPHDTSNEYNDNNDDHSDGNQEPFGKTTDEYE